MARFWSPSARTKRFLWIFGWILAGLLTLTAGLAGVALVMMTGQSGRDITLQLLNDRQISRYGTLQASGLTGNVLDDLSIDLLTLSDEDGVWLEIRDARLDWSLLPALSRRIEIETLTADQVIIHRRPVLSPPRPSSSSPRFQISVDRLDISAIEISETLPAGPAILTTTGELSRQNRGWTFNLDLERTDAPGDELFISGNLGETLLLDARLDASRDGPLASLLRVEGHQLTVLAQLSGPREAGGGPLSVQLDNQTIVQGDLSWDQVQTTLSAQLNIAPWPGLNTVAALLDGPAEVNVTVPLGEGRGFRPTLTALTGQVESPGLSAELQRQSATETSITLTRAGPALGALTGGSVTTQDLEFTGLLNHGDGLHLSGDLSIRDLSAPSYTAQTVTGTMDLTGPFSELTIETDLSTTGSRIGVERLQPHLGSRPDITTTLVYRSQTRELDILGLDLRGPDTRLQGEGRYAIRDERLEASLSLSNLSLADLHESLSGVSDADATLSGQIRGPLDIALSAELRSLDGRLADGLGATASLSADGRWNGGSNVQINALDVSSPVTTASLSALNNEQGWAANGQILWAGKMPVAAISMGGQARIDFEASADDGVLFARTQIQTGALSAGPVSLSDPLLRLELGGPLSDLSGDWRLTALENDRPVDLVGSVSRADDALSLQSITGEAFGVDLDAALTLGAQESRVRLAAAPQSGFGRISIDGRLGGDTFTLEARVEDLVGGDLNYLDDLTLTASGPRSDIQLQATASGAYGARFSLDLTGSASLTDPVTLLLMPRGEYGETRITERSRISVERQDGNLEARALLGLDDGVFDLALSSLEGTPITITAELEDVPAALLSYRQNRAPALGTLNGNGELVLDPEGWSGSVDISGRDLRPAGSQDDIPLAGRVSVSVNESTTQLNASVSSEALNGEASLSLASGVVTGFSDIMRAENAVTGQFSLEGQITPLAAFHIDEDRVISGQMEASAVLGGAIGSPDFNGSLQLRDAGLQDYALGLALVDISGEARFTDSGLVLDSLSGRGRDRGTFSATGRLDYVNSALSGTVDLTYERLQALDREDISVVADGNVQVQLQGRTIRVTGESVIERAEIRPPEAREQAIVEIAVDEINVPGDLRQTETDGAGTRFDIELDYRVEAPTRLFVRGPQFDTDWSMDMRVSGSPDNLILRGNANLLRGRANFLGRPFQFREGIVTFAGDPLDTRLNITAVRLAQDIEALLRVTGTVRNPQINLTSSPSLPQDEIAARILFGQGAGNLTGLQAAQMAAALSSVAGGVDPFASVREATGLDQLSLGSNAEGQTVVSGGRYLTEDVYLELEGTGGGAAPTTRIEWFLGRGLTLESELVGDGEGALALSWRIQYD